MSRTAQRRVVPVNLAKKPPAVPARPMFSTASTRPAKRGCPNHSTSDTAVQVVSDHPPSSLSTFAAELSAQLPTSKHSTPHESADGPPPHASLHPGDALPSTLNRIDEDLEESVINKPGQSKGQNQMMQEWLTESAGVFLHNVLLAETLDNPTSVCTYCHLERDRLFQCRDCLHCSIHCLGCLQTRHSNFPTHRLREWTGTHFRNVSPSDTGLVFHLGHGGLPCNMGSERDFTLGDLNGIHVIRVRFCSHPGKPGEVRQLMQAQIFPCSEKRAVSGFTFAVLRQFHLLATEAKLSAQRFYNVLVYLTDAIEPSSVPDRYREFLRTTREWQFLQDLKHAGAEDPKSSEKADGDLALRCPACPHPGENYIAEDVPQGDEFLYMFHISYDGSFQLYCKSKSYDKWDLCLSDGRKYFADSEAYTRFLSTINASQSKETSRDVDCNNHKAADNTWVRFTGVDETGIGSCVCARHSFFLPRGSVNFTSGERYAYADYAMVSVLTRALKDGVTSVGVHYDIMCHFLKKMWTRWSKLQDPLRPLSRSDFQDFIAAIPKFHLAGHTEGCFVRFSLNFMPGVGRLDAEGGERCWSNLNHAAGSTCEKGPGSRIDSLNQVMQQWNWAKTVKIGENSEHTAKKFKEAKHMTLTQRTAFKEFNRTIDVSLTSAWAQMSTEPQLKNRKWTSPFSLTDTPAMSISAKVKELELLERQPISAAAAHTRPGSAAWVTRSLEIISTQR
ncbi:hypothetical protein FS749_006276 [Ceratobasidium sp. UAMH 11750]|nr:hypothetical protein FS749_006276 [Ceratobasidium sp. UAMH 11750]